MIVLYFAWIRQKIGKSEERITVPVSDISALITHLKDLGPNYADAFADLSRIRVAVNQHHKGLDAKIGPDDEVAFFPPVTGG